MAEQQTILERPGRDWAKMLVDQGCGLQHLRPIRWEKDGKACALVPLPRHPLLRWSTGKGLSKTGAV